MTTLDPNFKICLRDVFTTKFKSGMIPETCEVIKIDKDKNIISLRSVSTNVVRHYSSEEVQIYFIKQTYGVNS